MGDRPQAGEQFRYVTSHPGQLNLTIVDRRNEYQPKRGKRAQRAMH